MTMKHLRPLSSKPGVPHTRPEQLRLLANRLKAELKFTKDARAHAVRNYLEERRLISETRILRVEDLIIRLARRAPDAGCTIEATVLLHLRRGLPEDME
jgi:hypothetical protein